VPDDDKSLDLIGIEKVVKSLPKQSIKDVIDVSIYTFNKAVSPILETTAGLGRLIKVKFDSLVDVQKVYAVEALMKANEKVKKASHEKKEKVIPKARIIIDSVENVSNETDDNLRDIWSNLIANELLTADVHPEFPRILKRLSVQDAQTLISIVESDKNLHLAFKTLAHAFALSMNSAISPFVISKYHDFSHEHLERLGLITFESSGWKLTLLGQEFLKAVTDPSLEEEK